MRGELIRDEATLLKSSSGGPRTVAPGLKIRPIRVWRLAVVGAIYWGGLLALTDPFRHSGNVWSRYMTIESIVERGTLEVGRSPLLKISGSPDIVRFRGRFYSDKPPALSAIGAVVYWPIRLAGVVMSASATNVSFVNRILVTMIVGVASALAVVGFRAMLQLLDARPIASDLISLAFGFGSLLLTYGVTFNNHSVAAGLITAAVALVVLEAPGPGHQACRALAGGLTALAATIDLPPGGLWFVLLAGWLCARERRAIVSYLVGAFAPLAAHAILQSAITGTPLPAEFYPEAFEYPGSYWSSARGTFDVSVSRGWFLLEFLVGPQGWITVTPLLSLAAIGLWFGLRNDSVRLRAFAFLTIASTFVLVVYYCFVVRRTDFAGQSFGTRHMLAVTPVLAFWSVMGTFGRRARALLVPLVIAAWAIGAIYAFEGMKQPWSRIERRPEATLKFLQRFVAYPYSSYRR